MENSYVIGDYHFSKNKVNRDINYLMSVFTDVKQEIIILVALLHDSRLAKEDMQKVMELLGINR